MGLFAVCGGQACGREATGVIVVSLRLETLAGAPRSCADLGATQLRLALYRSSPVAEDVAELACGAQSSGRETFALQVRAGDYDRLALSFITATGETVRVCTSAGLAQAVLEVSPLAVPEGAQVPLDLILAGDGGPCPAAGAP